LFWIAILPPEVHQESAVGDVHDPNPGEVLQAAHDLLTVDAVPGLHRDVADDTLPPGFDNVDRADVAARLSDSEGDATKHAGPVRDLEADGKAVRGAGEDRHQCASMQVRRSSGPDDDTRRIPG